MTIEYDQIERLEALLAERNDRIGVLEANLEDAMTVIRQNAASLAEAEDLTKRNAELMNGYLARIAELESQILHQTAISACRIEERERHQKQIAALQEIAIEERAAQIYPYTWPLWENLPKDEFERTILGSEKKTVMWGKDEYRQKARRQLAEEHPEAFR